MVNCGMNDSVASGRVRIETAAAALGLFCLHGTDVRATDRPLFPHSLSDLTALLAALCRRRHNRIDSAVGRQSPQLVLSPAAALEEIFGICSSELLTARETGHLTWTVVTRYVSGHEVPGKRLTRDSAQQVSQLRGRCTCRSRHVAVVARTFEVFTLRRKKPKKDFETRLRKRCDALPIFERFHHDTAQLLHTRFPYVRAARSNF